MKNDRFDLVVEDEMSKGEKGYKMVWMCEREYYGKRYGDMFKEMVEWMREEGEKLKIEYVFERGDIVDD